MPKMLIRYFSNKTRFEMGLTSNFFLETHNKQLYFSPLIPWFCVHANAAGVNQIYMCVCLPTLFICMHKPRVDNVLM
jgi:hypothetical protein